MNKILLLDSNSLLNRAFYALPLLSNTKGQFTNAVFGYLSMLSKLIADLKPTHVGAVFDVKAPTFRHKMYDAYKGTRKPMPEELKMQLPIMHEMLSLLGVKILELEGYEADDIIGTIAKRFQVETFIVSGDKDVLQLVDDTTSVMHTKRGVTELKIYTPETMIEEGLTPQQIIEYKGLAGDSSDNIPGAPGVGEKTAKDLLARYGSIAGVYDHLGELKGKLHERLRENRDTVELSRTLATINTEVPIVCELKDLAYSHTVPAGFIEGLKMLECKTLIPRFQTEGTVSEEEKEEVSRPEFTTVTVKTVEELKNALKETPAEIAVTFGKDISFSTDGITEYLCPVPETFFDEGLSYEEIMGELQEILQSGTVVKHIFDVKKRWHEGVEISKPYEDVLLKSYLCDCNRVPKSAEQMLLDAGLETGGGASLFHHSKELDKKLKALELVSLYREIELPLIEVLYDMEKEGVTVDGAVLSELSARYAEIITELTEKIYETAGVKFNINSPKQLGEVLFEKLNLKLSKKNKTKTGFSVSAEVLEELEHPIAELLLKYRKFTKLQSTYLDGMRPLIHKDGKLHTVFHQCLTVTGRLSSTEPNLQNIPVRNDEGREIRKMLVASPGNVLVSADYSQIELRLLAHFSGDPVLTEGYLGGADIHAVTASKIYGIPFEEVTPAMRRGAKAVNFGIIYGISAFGLAKNIGIGNYEAARFQEKYFETYPSVKAYMDSNVKYAVEHGYIRSLSGRRRDFPELKSPNRNVRNFGERAAMNMPLQGSASDIIKIAMLRVYERLKRENLKAKLVLQVHDELILDTPKAEAERVAKILKEEMEGAYQLRIPLVAEAKIGYNWFEAK